MKHRRGIDLTPETPADPAVGRRFVENARSPSPGAAYVLPEQTDVAGICRACGHTAELTSDALKESGVYMKPFHLYEHRLICIICGK